MVFRCCLFVLLIGCSLARSSDRRTDDLDTDLIRRLIEANEFREARWLCESNYRKFQSDIARASKWAAHWSSVLSAEGRNDLFAGPIQELVKRLDEQTQKASAPIDIARRSLKTDTGADLFLAASSLNLEASLLRAAIVASAISSSPKEIESELLKRVPKLQSSAVRLIESASKARSLLTSKRNQGPQAYEKSQYERLEQDLSVIRVSLAMLQSELFPANSKDAFASAADAASLAERVLLTLPQSTPAHAAVEALLAEAYLRSGSLDNASRLIAKLSASNAGSVDIASLYTLKTRYAVKSRAIESAERLVIEYVKTAGKSLPDGTEMDFAQLDVLLAAGESQNTINAYLNAIEEKGGAFRRRRAEALVLDQFESSEGTNAKERSPISPAMIAAQGEQALRQGDKNRAVAFLWRAATAAKDSESAIAFAAKATAVSASVGETYEATIKLREVARRHATGTDASAAMLQSAVLLAKDSETATNRNRLDQLEDTLLEVVQTWPNSSSADTAYKWLQRMMAQTSRLEDSAGLAAEYLLLSGQVTLVNDVAEKQFRLLQPLSTESASDRLQSLQAMFSEVESEHRDLKPEVDRVAAWLLDVPFIEARSVNPIDDDLLNALLGFRSGRSVVFDPSLLSQQDSKWAERVRWRLVRDAILISSRQNEVGDLLERLPDATSLDIAIGKFWSVPSRDSANALVTTAAERSDRRESLRIALEVVSSVNQSFAFEAASEIAERLAQTYQIGRRDWYRAKIESCELLVRAGDVEGAKKRAQYIMLTRPPQDLELRESLSEFVDGVEGSDDE